MAFGSYQQGIAAAFIDYAPGRPIHEIDYQTLPAKRKLLKLTLHRHCLFRQSRNPQWLPALYCVRLQSEHVYKIEKQKPRLAR